VALLGAGSTLAASAERATTFMVLAGAPLGEPIAHYGPFVMNTRAEIDQAILDFQEGRMGRLE
jgi:redox-sensitive bicupin YhaK (pirin superfamily)